MDIKLRLKADVERKLRKEAARRGLTPESYLELLAAQAVSTGRAAPTSRKTWESEWRSWAAKHVTLPRPADDDREDIYAGRGE